MRSLLILFFVSLSLLAGVIVLLRERFGSGVSSDTSVASYGEGKDSALVFGEASANGLSVNAAPLTLKEAVGDDLEYKNRALRIREDAVNSKKIAFHAIEQEDIDTDSVTSRIIRDGTIRGRDINTRTNVSVRSLTLSDGATIGGNADVAGVLTVRDDAYDATGWDGSFAVPTKSAIRDKIESMLLGTGIDHGGLTGLGDDDHLQYALLAGRSGGQTLIGGIDVTDALNLQGTSGNGTLSGAAIRFKVGNAGATDAVTILNNGNVGVGISDPLGIFHVKSDTNATMYFDRYGGAPPNIIFRRANGTSILPTAVGLDNQLFAIGGRGYGSTGFSSGGRVAVFGAASETWTDANQGAYLAFTTTRNGTSTTLERMRIADNGNIGISNTSPNALLDIGTAGTTLGVIRLEGSASGYVALQPAAAAGSVTITFPAAAGTVALGTGTAGYNAYWSDTNTLVAEQYVALSRGGTNASLTASNGGIVYSAASSLAVLSGTATANQLLLSGSNAAPAWSAATYPSSTVVNQILYSSATNTVTGLTTANNAFLTTNGSGVPSMTALSSDIFTQYALLAGRSGGQTLIGGTAANNVLNLQGNSATGNTSTNASINFKVGDSGGTTAVTILNNGNVGINSASPSSLLTLASTALLESAVLGSELASTGWTTTDWTGSFAAGFTHTTGNTTSLTNTLAAVTNNLYQISYTVTGRTAGSFTINFGGVSNSGLTATGTWGPKAISTGTFSIAPTTDFNGTIVVSVKQITGTYSPTYAILNSAGSASFEIRSTTNGLGNTFIGVGAGGYNTTGSNNSAEGYQALSSNTTGSNNSAQGVYALYSNTTGSNNSAQGYRALSSNTTGNSNSAQGYQALYSNTTGYYNSAQGVSALYSNTTGYYNSAQGYRALSSNTTGSNNSAQGVSALYSNTTGYNNSAQGMYALFSNTTGSYNSALGYQAGRYISGGSVGNTTSSNSLYLGTNTMALADGDTNEIVIGYNATGLGSNTAVLGNDSIVTTVLKGNVGIGTTSPSGLLELSSALASDSVFTITSATATNDPLMKFRTGLTPAIQFSLGVDTSDSNTFKIFGGDGFSGAGDLAISSSGVTTIANLRLGSQSFETDAGIVSWGDMPVTSASTIGTVESYVASIDGNPLLSLYSESDGSGSVRNMRVGINQQTPLLTLDVAGSLRATGTATSVITGSIDPTASTTVTGVGTLFATELVVGDRITVSGETKTVTAIASDTSLTVDTAFSDNANDASVDKLEPIFVARDASNVVKMIVGDTGNVGIGKSNPAYALDVLASGTGVIARFNSANNTSCTLATDGTLSCSSDQRLKKNVDPLTPGLETLLSLRPVEYNWKYQSDSEAKSLGFIAQEVEQVLPKLVMTDGNGYKSLNTIGMVPLIVKSVQDQQAIISGISLDVNTNASSLGTLKTSVDEELTATRNVLKSVEARLTDAEAALAHLNGSSVSTNNTLENQIATETSETATDTTDPAATDSATPAASSFEDSLKIVQDRLLTLETANETLLKFYNDFDLGNVPVVISGNLDLGDVVVTVKDLHANGNVKAQSGDVRSLTVGAIAVRNGEEGEMIGTAKLCPVAADVRGAKDALGGDAPDDKDDCSGEPMGSDSLKGRDGKSLFIPTSGVSATSRIFITPRTVLAAPLAVTEVNTVMTATREHPVAGFTVSLKSPTDQPIDFDWMIVNEEK